jgi:NadR type nicotinamide-nucleotide adenylyltransferase
MEENLKQHSSSCIRVVFFGPESTGKTTLAKRLAKIYQTRWVLEFAREYLEEKLDRTGEICAPEDIWPIAVGQMKSENEAVQQANTFLFCDTNLLSTEVYAKAYFDGWCDTRLLEANKVNHYDIYFLTDIDVPFEQDLLRDRPHQRQEMLAAFKNALNEHNITYVILKGSCEARILQVTDYLKQYV